MKGIAVWFSRINFRMPVMISAPSPRVLLQVEVARAIQAQDNLLHLLLGDPVEIDRRDLHDLATFELDCRSQRPAYEELVFTDVVNEKPEGCIEQPLIEGGPFLVLRDAAVDAVFFAFVDPGSNFSGSLDLRK